MPVDQIVTSQFGHLCAESKALEALPQDTVNIHKQKDSVLTEARGTLPAPCLITGAEEVASRSPEKLMKMIPHEIVGKPGLSHKDHRQCFLDVAWTVQRSSPKN